MAYCFFVKHIFHPLVLLIGEKDSQPVFALASLKMRPFHIISVIGQHQPDHTIQDRRLAGAIVPGKRRDIVYIFSPD